MCFCASVPRIDTAVQVVILQHPRESRMPVGTALMASLCLPTAKLVVGTHLEQRLEVAAALADTSRTPILLWPGPGAINLEEAPPVGSVTLFVLDGTWSTAKKMLRFNPRVASLPRYSLTPQAPSQYRIRREPRAECLSTIEAIAMSLGALEGNRGKFDLMMDPFLAMVQKQIQYETLAPTHRHRKHRVRRRSVRRFKQLADIADRLVIIGAESNAWPKPDRPKHKEELLHFVATRLATGEVFEAIARPQDGLAPMALVHTQLTSEQIFAQGEALADVRKRWQSFVGPQDILASWGGYAEVLRQDAGIDAGDPAMDLKPMVRKFLGGARGDAKAIGELLGVNDTASVGSGRCGRRLGHVVDLIRKLSADFEWASGPPIGAAGATRA